MLTLLSFSTEVVEVEQDPQFRAIRFRSGCVACADAVHVRGRVPGRSCCLRAGLRRVGTSALIAAVPARPWHKISAGAGAHGPRHTL